MNKIVALALDHVGDFTTERFTKNGSVSLLVYNTEKRPKKFKVILNGHLDVIPGKDEGYKAKLIGNKLYGVGALDMKASVACIIEAFKMTAKEVNYPLALQLVTDEQAGGLLGTKHQIDKGVLADFIIAGEATNFNIVNMAKGVLWLKISSKGKASHSAYPWQGRNAIMEMNSFLNVLKRKYPTPYQKVWKTTLSISKIETTNSVFNNIPDDCTVWIDVRYVPNTKLKTLSELRELMSRNLSLEIVFEQEPLDIDEGNKYIKLLQQVAAKKLNRTILLYGAHGTSDVTYYASVGCSGIEFGPSGINGDTNLEYVDIRSLETYYQILTTFLLSLNETVA